jgi:hypothetical protein
MDNEITEQTEQKNNEIFKNTDIVLRNVDFTACLTHISNINLNGFIEMGYQTFKDKFLVNELDNMYVYSENQKIKYNKKLVDLSLLAIQNFLHNDKKTQLKSFTLDTKVFIDPNEPKPIIFVFNSSGYYNSDYDFALVVAPTVESD